MRASKRLTLDDELEDAGFGHETRYLFEERRDSEGCTSDDDSLDNPPEEARLRLRPDITLEGQQYSGKKSSRKEAFPEDIVDAKLSGKKRSYATYSDSESVENNSEDFEDDGGGTDFTHVEDEIQSLAKEYSELRDQEQSLLKTLKQQGDEDFRKGQAVKNQKALWDKSLEIRICLQKVFSASNQLPQEPVKSAFCHCDEKIDKAYSELAASAEETLNILLQLQEVLFEKNCNFAGTLENGDKNAGSEDKKESLLSTKDDTTWEKINALNTRIIPFRDHSVDKWHRKTQLSAGAAAMKSKLHAFNQSISHQVASYMRDPSSMINRMQLAKSSIHVLGTSDISDQLPVVDEEGISENPTKKSSADGDPELLDDSEFYQQLLQEFLESTDSTLAGQNLYAMKKMRNKKRKDVDRRASKSRKIRYNVHEKIVNFMASEPMVIPPMAEKLFSNLFGLQNA